MVRWRISKLIDVPPKNLLCITSIPIKLEKRNKVVGRMALASLLDRVAKERLLAKATTVEQKPFACPSLLLLRGDKEENFCFSFYVESMCFN